MLIVYLVSPYLNASYYWLSPGVYMVYGFEVYNTKYNASISMINVKDLISGKDYIINTSNILLNLTVLEVKEPYIKILAQLKLINAEDIEKRETVNITLSQEYLVNIKTLDTYVINVKKGEKIWVTEWPFLLQPDLTSKKGLKLLMIHRGKSFSMGIKLSNENIRILKKLANKVNEIVQKLTNGTKSYRLKLEQSPVKMFKTSSTSDFRIILLAENTASFLEISPPPTNTSFSNKRIFLGGERIAFSSLQPMFMATIPEGVIELFKKLYCTERPFIIYNFTLPNIKKPGYFLITPQGDVCYVMIIGDEVKYDAITGLLLELNSLNLYGNLISFLPVISDKIRIYVQDPNTIVKVQLKDTNVPFERPVLGGKELTIEGIKMDHVIPFIIAITIIVIILSIILYIRKYKK